jgi:hypothetical protein
MNLKIQKKTILSFFMILGVLTYFHNFSVSSSTKARDFDYQAWQVLTKSTDIFQNVRDRDIFISEHQNDAYETNAGSFFYNTNIRLAYLFNSSEIWPNYLACTKNSNCLLSDFRKRTRETLLNLERGAFVKTDRYALQKNDWVNINSKPGALNSSKIWDFDEYPISTNTVIAYLAPYDETQISASILLRELNFVTISKDTSPILNPSLNGYCLVEANADHTRQFRDATVRVAYWKLPLFDQFGKSLPKSLDIRSMAVGTC